MKKEILKNTKELIRIEMLGITFPPVDENDIEFHCNSCYDLELKQQDDIWYLIDNNEELGYDCGDAEYLGLNDKFYEKLEVVLKKDGYEYEIECAGRLILYKVR